MRPEAGDPVGHNFISILLKRHSDLSRSSPNNPAYPGRLTTIKYEVERIRHRGGTVDSETTARV
jgi:hypothetical protein